MSVERISVSKAKSDPMPSRRVSSSSYVNERMDTLDRRLRTSRLIRDYVRNISPCISVKNDELVLVDKTTNAELVYLYDPIGSRSQNGYVYANTGVGLYGRKLVFSTKITPNLQEEEIYHLLTMSRLAENGISPNMPITYKVLNCEMKYPRLSIRASHIVENGEYFVIINELADGDLNAFLKLAYTDEECESVLCQALLAIATFHTYTKHVHNDTSTANFLFHKIKKGGYWWYKYRDIDIYVPNTGYLVVLWDPGVTVKIVENPNPLFTTSRDFTYLLKTLQDKRRKFPIKESVISKFEKFTELFPFLEQQVQNTTLTSIIFDKKRLPRNSKLINTNSPYIL